jgi:hypothetical protein
LVKIENIEKDEGCRKRIDQLTPRQRLRLCCGFVARAVSDEFVPGNKSTGSFQKLTAKVLEISNVPILR